MIRTIGEEQRRIRDGRTFGERLIDERQRAARRSFICLIILTLAAYGALALLVAAK